MGDLIQVKVHEGPFAGKFVDCQIERVRVDGAGKSLLDVVVTRADRYVCALQLVQLVQLVVSGMALRWPAHRILMFNGFNGTE